MLIRVLERRDDSNGGFLFSASTDVVPRVGEFIDVDQSQGSDYRVVYGVYWQFDNGLSTASVMVSRPEES